MFYFKRLLVRPIKSSTRRPSTNLRNVGSDAHQKSLTRRLTPRVYRFNNYYLEAPISSVRAVSSAHPRARR